MSAAPLAGRGALVTGASRGIGLAVAMALASAGARVVLAAREPSALERAVASLAAGGATAWGMPADVAEEASVQRLGAFARERLGAVEVLVNNAGVSSSAPLARITRALWEQTLAINATGTFLCTREFVPEMVARRWGRVVNVASRAGLEGGRYVAHYAAAKHAVIGFTRSVALELEGTGVTINAVCPGYVDTPMTEQTLDNVRTRTGLARDAALAAVLASSGQTRLVTAAEVAAAVLALCTEASAATNGEAVRLDGAEVA